MEFIGWGFRGWEGGKEKEAAEIFLKPGAAHEKFLKPLETSLETRRHSREILETTENKKILLVFLKTFYFLVVSRISREWRLVSRVVSSGFKRFQGNTGGSVHKVGQGYE